MNLQHKLLFCSALFASGVAQAQDQPGKSRPNVIIIYSDDQGAIDLNCFGARDLITPNIDRLVNSGIRFTQFYGAPVCSPSRAGVLTGKTPQRAGVPGNVSSLSMEAGLPGEQYTIAEMFHDAGYKQLYRENGIWVNLRKRAKCTGFIFIWSFCRCIDNYSHFFFWEGPNRHDLYRNGEEVFYPGRYFPDLMVEEASKFMETNKDHPFFMYYAMNTPHYPYQGSPEWLKYYQQMGVPYPRNLYAAFISTMDEKVGLLLQKLKNWVCEKIRSLFTIRQRVFNRERAHYGGGSARFRGSKFSLLRAASGFSSNQLAGKTKKGAVRNQLAVNADWMPTLAELAGIDANLHELYGRALYRFYR